MTIQTKELDKAAANRSKERFMTLTGGTETQYYTWSGNIGKRIHINKLDTIICTKLEIYTLSHLIYRSTELPIGLPLSEVDHYLIDNSQNPYELAKLWVAANINAKNYTDKESILADHLRSFPKSDFIMFGDKNNLDAVNKSWFKNDGVNLDVKIAEINDMCLYSAYISIQDAIDFVMSYRPGGYKNPAQLILERIEAQFKAVTSFQVKDYYVEHIMNMCEVAVYEPGDAPF